MTCSGADQFLGALRQLCPGFAVDGPPIWTETSLLLPGRIAGILVLAKHPVDPRAFWQDRCRHEITVYQALASAPSAPVLTPVLVADDAEYPFLVITRLSGRPLHPSRYPPGPVHARTLTGMLDVLDALHHWRPPAGFPDDSDYRAQFAGYDGDLMSPADLGHITRLCDTVMPPAQLEHGDAHLGNTLDTPDGIALVDLECTAWRPAGYDLAKLWIFLASSPGSRAAILSAVTSQPRQLAGFWVAVALVAVREITSHRRHPSPPEAAGRLRQLHGDLREALTHIHHLHNQLTPQAHLVRQPANLPGRAPRRSRRRPQQH